MKEKNKGITLIALVVTIVVLLILAGVGISMLTGDNGIITQSQNAKDNTEQAKVEEHVSVAIGSLISKFNGEVSGITPKMIADQINEDENRTDVYAENETTFPTNIIFPKENRKAEANLNTKGATETDSIYSADVNETDIAPVDLFDYEIINNGETGALKLDNLPTRTVRITRIKPEFCNSYDTNYEIVYNGTKINNTLIVPYQVDGKFVTNGIEGELYKIVEVNLRVQGGGIYSYTNGYSWPVVETIIYPNTIKKIYGQGQDLNSSRESYGGTIYLKNVVLSKNLETIGQYTFAGCNQIKKLVIHQGASNIGSYSFYSSKFESIAIPKSVTNIDSYAFYEIGQGTIINYEGTEEEWNKISIGSGNYDLENVTINYNYKY